MRLHAFSKEERALFSELEMFYNQLRILQEKSNRLETRCVGSGHCCKVGLMIPLVECGYIAYNIIQQYFLTLEGQGKEQADQYMENMIEKLKETFTDETWDKGVSERFCVFYDGGCTVYPFRPATCRAYGTIVGVDDFCPRTRNVYGNVDVVGGKYVRDAVQGFQAVIEQYDALAANGNGVVCFMPLGVLRFLLSDDEMKKLSKTTDPKFWQAYNDFNISYVTVYGREWNRG